MDASQSSASTTCDESPVVLTGGVYSCYSSPVEKQKTEVQAYSAMVAGAPSSHVSTAVAALSCNMRVLQSLTMVAMAEKLLMCMPATLVGLERVLW
jgi:hypothetical protein